MVSAGGITLQSPLSTVTIGSLLALALMALMAVFYATLKGKLRSESAIQEVRADRDARIAELRADRDARLEEARRQIEVWREAYEVAEGGRRSQEALLREATLELGRTVQHVVGALQDARDLALSPPEKDTHA